MSLPPATIRRVMREVTELQSSPPEGVRVAVDEDNMLDVTGIIQGPESTPYAGGYFRVKFKFGHDFPAAPPKCWFATKIFHPNVSTAGEICVNTLKKDWQPTYGIGHILLTVKCLLIYPNPDSALDADAGALLQEDYDAYCARARMLTAVHATPRVRPAEFDIPSKVEVSIKDQKPGDAAPEASTSALKGHTPPVVPVPTVTTQPAVRIASHLRKSASPAPPMRPSENSAPHVLMAATKERHVSPSPLATADANVAAKVGAGAGSKAVKRSATGAAASGAEKRKKALKRL